MEDASFTASSSPCPYDPADPQADPSTESEPCEAELGFEPIELAHRSDGWTPERQRAFIGELADCGLVSEAAARVGMTARSANRLRRRQDAGSFRMAWDAAIRLGADRLRSVAFERAVNGTVRPRYYHGQVVGEERVYDNRLLTYLLGQLQADRISRWDCDRFLATAGHGLPAPETIDAPVWNARDGSWRTGFPPPDGFTGDEHGCFGSTDYHRSLTAEEEEAMKASLRREQEKLARARDLYFGRRD